MKRIATVFVFGLLVLPTVYAQQQQEEMVTVPKSSLTKEQLSQVEDKNLEKKIARYGQWVGLGKEVGEAVNGSLSAITHQADEFSKTGVGKFTMFLVAWKVLGTDIIQFFVGSFLLLVGIPLWIWSYRQTCIPRRVAIETGANKEVVKYEVINKDRNDERWSHVITFGLFIGICLIVMFA